MKESVQTDLYEDFYELLYLTSNYKKSLLEFRKSIIKLPTHPSVPFLMDEANRLVNSFEELERQTMKFQAQTKKASAREIEKLSNEKRRIFIELRSIIPMIGSLITSTDWQSPSFSHSLHSEAGIQEGKIIAHINDYKRDQHLNEREYQNQFLKEYVDGIKIPASAYLVSSGMAALTTIITFLRSRKDVKGSVMMGGSMYFENTELIETLFTDRKIIKVDEINTEHILKIYDTHQPDVIILDSLCNSPTIAVPDIPAILKYVSNHAKKNTYFVIDNSTLSIALQPLKIVRLPSKVKLIVFESLNKYHEFGLDRVTGGIMWFRGTGIEELYDARDHAGTNTQDSAVYTLPRPSRKHLQKRLNRLNRNVTYLAESLSEFILQNDLKKVDSIIYPGLKNHPSNEWSKKYSFQGSYFVIAFQKPYQTVKIYKSFVDQVIKSARREKVALVGGTSFGFNTTRIYLTAQNSKYGDPFIRVSVGTENMAELERIKDVFTKTLQSF